MPIIFKNSKNKTNRITGFTILLAIVGTGVGFLIGLLIGIYKTLPIRDEDPIAKKIRKYLKENNINKKIPVVYSKEQNKKFEGSIPSMIFVPATAGILCANYVICDIIK